MKIRVKVYHTLRYIMETIFGTRFNELVWRFRHIYKPSWAEEYTRSFRHPHRQLLVNRISGYAPFNDVLEIGCATGSNLFLLAKRFPDARCVGIDINPEAIRQGAAFFKRQSIYNVSLSVGKADDLRFPDKSFDVVFTDAVLMYIGPDKIRKVATEIRRVARRVIILFEHCSEQKDSLGSYGEKWWLRDYTKLFQPFGNHFSATKITSDTWGGNWSKFGYIIEIERRN